MARNRHSVRNVAGAQTRTIEHVAAYIRVSTDEQAVSGIGLADQRERCELMARMKGWPVPTVYSDEGYSGMLAPAKRPGMVQLLADIAAGHMHAVIVSELSRIGREMDVVVRQVKDFGEYGVAFVSCAQQIDTATPTGKVMLAVFAMLAELERDQIAERTRGAMRQLRRTTGEIGGRVPYGYVRDADGTVQVAPVAALGVRRVFQLHRRGLSLREIAEKLQADGHPSPRGGAWHHTAVATILGNRSKYVGGARCESTHTWPRILAASSRRGDDPILRAADDAALEAVHA